MNVNRHANEFTVTRDKEQGDSNNSITFSFQPPLLQLRLQLGYLQFLDVHLRNLIRQRSEESLTVYEFYGQTTKLAVLADEELR